MRCARWIPACAMLAAFGLACAGQQEREVPAREVGEVKKIAYGEVTSVEKVELTGTDRYEGALIGAGLGAIAGAVIGPGTRGSIAGGVIGAIAGGLAGRKVQEELRDDGYEYEIRLDDGSRVSVVEVHDEPIDSGERVRLVYGEDTVRIEESTRSAISRR